VRLQWGNGVASRGRLAGASLPVQAEADTRRPVRRGRQRDLQKDTQSSNQAAGAQRLPRDASLENVLDAGVTGSESYTPTDLQAYDDATAWPPTPSDGDNIPTLSPHSPDERALFQECE